MGFITVDQAEKFAKQADKLLKKVGDGVNFDFEHISFSGNRTAQIKAMAHAIHYTSALLKPEGK